MGRTFTLLRTLGRGAHGSVHLAELRDDDDYVQTLAVKRLLPHCTADPDLVARLKDEARLLALLRHDHVVRVHGLTRIDGALAILMEPVDGVDLGTLVAKVGALPPRVALEVIEAVADALDAAWNTRPEGQDRPLHVVHRDIKPSNVMLTARGGVKVMDFGVARATFEAREVETRSQQYGTARYMAPERWLQGEAVHASDVFALGVTLCEVGTGRQVPRPRLSPELFDADVAVAVAGLAPPLAALVVDMTRFAPEDRPTAGEVVERCRALLGEVTGPGLRVWAATHVSGNAGEALDTTATATVVHEESVTREPPAPPPPRPRPVVVPWWAVAGIGVALLAVPVGRRLWAAPTVEPPPATVLTAAPAPESVPPAPPAPAPEPPVPAVPAPVRAAPSPVARPTPEPPAPAEPAPVVAEAPRVPVRLVLPPGVVADTDWGRVSRSPAVLDLPPATTVELRLEEGADRWTCHISTGAGQVRVRPHAEGGGCLQ